VRGVAGCNARESSLGIPDSSVDVLDLLSRQEGPSSRKLRLGSGEAGVNGQERRSGHAVLKAGPRRFSQSLLIEGLAEVEHPDPPSESEDLRPGKIKLNIGHRRPRLFTWVIDRRTRMSTGDTFPAMGCGRHQRYAPRSGDSSDVSPPGVRGSSH